MKIIICFLLFLQQLAFAEIILSSDGMLKTTSFDTPLPGDITCSYTYAHALEKAEAGCIEHGFHWDAKRGACINTINQLFLAGKSTENMANVYSQCNCSLMTTATLACGDWLKELNAAFISPPIDEVLAIPQGAKFSPAHIVFPVTEPSGHWTTSRFKNSSGLPIIYSPMGDHPAATRPVDPIAAILEMAERSKKTYSRREKNSRRYRRKLSENQQTFGYKVTRLLIPEIHQDGKSRLAIFLPSVQQLNEHLETWNRVFKREIFALRFKESSLESEDVLTYLRGIAEHLHFPIAQTSMDDATVATHDHFAHVLGFILAPHNWNERTQAILQFWLGFYDSLKKQRQKEMLQRLVLTDIAILIDAGYANIGIDFGDQFFYPSVPHYGWQESFLTGKLAELEQYNATYSIPFKKRCDYKKADFTFPNLELLWNSARLVTKLRNAYEYNKGIVAKPDILNTFKAELGVSNLAEIHPDYTDILIDRFRRNEAILQEILTAYERYIQPDATPPTYRFDLATMRTEFDARMKNDFPFWEL